MACLVCCVIQLQFPRGVGDKTFPRSLDVRGGAVVMERQVKVHLSLRCLCFMIQKLSPVGWAPSEVLLCIDDGL